MLETQEPWIELFGADEPARPPRGSAPAGVRAQFALLVNPRPFAERMTMKWGWNAGAAFEEALGRIRQFILTLHYRNYQALAFYGGLQKAIALRCRCFPEQRRLSLCLVAGITGQDAHTAQANARDFFYELSAGLPYDWTYAPIGSPDAFRRYAGVDLLQNLNGPRSIVEIGRYESALSNPRSPQYLLGEWRSSPYASELIWRALANSPVPVLLSVLLQPTLLYEAELNILPQLANPAQENPDPSASLTCQHAAARATDLMAERLHSWRYPYLLQIHLVSSQGVPAFVERVVGSTLTYTDEQESLPPGYFAICPQGNGEFWRESLLTLTPILGVSGGSKPYQRLRLLASSEEACAVLQLPYPNEYGIPGVDFVTLEPE